MMYGGMPEQLIRTKLVATIGPSSCAPEKLSELLEAGVDVCRLNFSHGTHADHGAALRVIRDWSTRRGRAVAVLGDLCGPKIRLNGVSGGQIALPTGATLRIVRGTADSTVDTLSTSYPRTIDEVDVGHRVYIDDGLVRLIVSERTPDDLRCHVTTGGTIRPRKGVNFPDTKLSVPALTEKDCADARWAVAHDLDYLALSFVRHPEDLRALHGLLSAERKSGVRVIVKIERIEALEHLDELVALSDGVMVARGDLGVEMDVWQVPLVQKAITARCREFGKPVIIATQMLQSMVEHPAPTRAEVSDVANAILDATDAVMLSAESASGQYPLAAVQMMGLVSQATEAFQSDGVVPSLGAGAPHARPTSAPPLVDARQPRTSAIAEAAVHAARHLHARLVVVWTATGETARLVARARLAIPVVALTSDVGVWRRLALYYGVIPLLATPSENPAETARLIDALLIERGLAARGDVIVVVTSTRPTTPGATNTTLVHRIGDDI